MAEIVLKPTFETFDPRYFKLHSLINVVSTKTLRFQFLAIWKLHTGLDWNRDKEESSRVFVTGIGKSYFDSSKNLQRKLLRQGNIEEWDLGLLGGAIETVYRCIPTTNLPPTSVTKKELQTLREIRNRLAHKGSTAFDEVGYQKDWNSALAILKRLGVSEDELAFLEDMNFTLNSTDKPSEEETKSNELKEKGNKAFREMDYLRAIQLYSDAALLKGLSSDVLGTLYSNRSTAYFQLEEMAEAKDNAKRAIALKPYWPKAYFRLATVYEKEGKYEKALLQHELALQLDPKYTAALNGRAFCRNMLERIAAEQHMDPVAIDQSNINPSGRFKFLEGMLGMTESFKKILTIDENPHFICGEGHKHASGQRGYQQDWAAAARCYAKAHKIGSAEGAYNLGLLVLDGKGVERNPELAHGLFLQAANMDPTCEIIPGCGITMIRLGVLEAQHKLGLNYEAGVWVEQNYETAAEWYRKAIEIGCGFGFSSNNLAILYSKGLLRVGHDKRKALLYWKLASYRGNVRAMECLFHEYLGTEQYEEASNWYHYGIENGSLSLPHFKHPILSSIHFRRQSGFHSSQFTKNLKEELLLSELKRHVPLKKYMLGTPLDVHFEGFPGKKR